MRLAHLLPVVLFASACRVYESVGGLQLPDTGPDTTSDDTGLETDTADTTDTGEADPIWDEAMLYVLAPESGSFLPMEEEAEFEAVVRDVEGNDLEWDAIDWSSDVDDEWAFTAATFTDDSLSVGKHDLTATTTLPNGDRLAMTVGDVLVQSPYAGTYTGSIYVEITITYDTTSYTVSCAGATTIIVDQQGELLGGDSTCMVSLMGYDMDMSMSLDAENSDGSVEGEMAVDMMLFDVGIAASGELTEEGELTVSFAEDVYGYIGVDGSVEASRISRDTELSDE